MTPAEEQHGIPHKKKIPELLHNALQIHQAEQDPENESKHTLKTSSVCEAMQLTVCMLYRVE